MRSTESSKASSSITNSSTSIFSQEEFDPYMDDLEAMELGLCREVISSELYMPCHPSRDWVRCYIATTSPDNYRMYIDGKKRRFLLSAKQFEQDNYYISAHEDFPMIVTKPKRGYLGKVELQRDLSYLISLNQCHLCDNKLGLFTCARGQGDREVVGRIVHSIKHIKTNGAEEMEYRYMKVLLPVVTDAGIRKIWCPRSFRKINSDVPNSADIADALYYCPHMCTKYVNKMPEWSKKVNNLVLKFQGDRILTASAKNFLLYEEKLFDVVESPSRMRTNSSNSNNCSNEKEFSELQIVIDGGNGLNNIQDGYSSTNSYSKGRGNSFGYESNDNRSPGKHFFDLPENNKNYSIYSYRDNKHNNSKVSSSSLNNKQLRNNRFASSGRSNGAAYSNRNSTNNFKSGTKSNSYYQNNTDSERDDLVIESDFKDGLGSNSSSTVTTPSSTPGKSSVKGEYRKKKKKALELDASDVAVIQFGKSTSTKFVLDFRYPISPIQAFGIAVSTFAYQDNYVKNYGAPPKTAFSPYKKYD